MKLNGLYLKKYKSVKRFSLRLSLVLAFSFFSNSSFASSKGLLNRLNTIDLQDTIFFDLSNAVFSAGTVEFPVYFISDDTINALDFAMRFNQANLQYDTIFSLLTGLSANFFLNPADSTLRFTSYNLSQMNNSIHVASLKFNTTLNSISSTDFFNLEAYLNGFPCAYHFIESVSSIGNIPSISSGFYPNPANSYLVLPHGNLENLALFSIHGQPLKDIPLFRTASSTVISTEKLNSGVYFLQGEWSGQFFDFKFMVVH
jgi:hypothetical protein